MSSTPEPMSVLMDTWLIAKMTDGLLDDSLQSSGLSGDDFALYSLLNAYGPATPSQLARWTGMRSTTVSAALKRLASRGHTVQQRSTSDRRSYTVALSDAGRSAHRETAAVFWAETRTLAELLGEREREMRQQLQVLDASLREAAGLDPRPYALSGSPRTGQWQLSYTGQPLTPAQERSVRSYLDFVRSTPA